MDTTKPKEDRSPKKTAKRIDSHLKKTGRGKAYVPKEDPDTVVVVYKGTPRAYTPDEAFDLAGMLFCAYLRGYDAGKEAGILTERIERLKEENPA